MTKLKKKLQGFKKLENYSKRIKLQYISMREIWYLRTWQISINDNIESNIKSGENVDLKTSKKQIRKGFRPIVICILIFELCERLTFYSITANFVRFCTIYLEVDNVAALKISLVFTGGIYFICLFCGWVSDVILGKFRTIILSGLIYFMGVLLVTVVTFDFGFYFDPSLALTTTDRRAFSSIGLILIVFGTGGIKTTVGPFGVEQFDVEDESLIRLYFIWFYWFINIGSAVAFLVVTYIQQNIDFFTGFLIPLCSITMALIIFLVPQRYYNKNHKKSKNSLTTLISVIAESVMRRSKTIYKYQNLFDYARLSNGGSYEDHVINDIQKLKRILPILLTFIPFFISYVQMQSTYILQAERLYLNISTFVVPVASLSVVNATVIIFVIPVLAFLVYPIINKCFHKPPNPLQRIGFGLFLSAVSVFAAAFLEIARKKNIYDTGGIPQVVFANTYNVSSISVLMQIPQFFFVAVGEVFASATGLEFAYSQAPVSQKAIITGLYYVMFGLGSFCSSLLIEIVNINPENQWMPDNIDEGHYEYFFFLLGGIILVDVIVFIFIARKYIYADSPVHKGVVVKYAKTNNFVNVVSTE